MLCLNFLHKQHQIRQQLTRTVDPSSSLVLDLPTLKEHCRLPLDEDFTEEDSNLTIYGKAAERMVESHSETRLQPQTYRLDLQYLPVMELGICQSVVRLELMPVTALTSFKVNDTTNTLQTIPTDKYNLFKDALPPTVWVDPSCLESIVPNFKRPDAFQFTFTVGSDTVDAAAKEAILFLVGTFYQKRETVHLWSGKVLMEMPLSYQMLIEAMRWRL